MITKPLPYRDKQTELEGFIAYDEKLPGKRPAIVLCHAWHGRDDFVCEKAEEMANLGYVGFALDVYGKGVFGKSKEECTVLMDPFLHDRRFLQKRLLSALDAVRSFQFVDPTNIIVMGFCFGGLCALDIARSGTDVKGAISVHGLLNAPEDINKASIKAKILVLHGHDDPLVPPEQVSAFENEMTVAKVDWQLHTYGNTMHAFTNPIANDPGFGTVYNPIAARRAWHSIYSFFDEMFT